MKINVAVGIIINDKNEVLIAKRATHKHQGGLWEFPGGKIEAGETTEQALKREISEEVGLELLEITPFDEVNCQYEKVHVSLKICVSKKFQGEAKSLEGQAIKWLAINELDQYDFPAANRTIIKELQACYAKTIITSRELRARS